MLFSWKSAICAHVSLLHITVSSINAIDMKVIFTKEASTKKKHDSVTIKPDL